MAMGGNDSGETVDGRHARQIRHTSQLIRALVEYIREHGEVPTAFVLAERAKVSRRSAFRLFSDRTDLLRLTFDNMQAELRDQMPFPNLTEGTPREVVTRLVDYLAEAYEFLAPFNRVADQSLASADLIESERQRVRSLFRGGLRSAFVRMLPNGAMLSPVVRDSIRCTLSFRSWDQLRREQRAPITHAKAVMLHTPTAVLDDAGADV